MRSFLAKLKFGYSLFTKVLNREGWRGVSRRIFKRIIRTLGLGRKPLTPLIGTRPLVLLISGEPGTAGHVFRIDRLADILEILGYECRILASWECPSTIPDDRLPSFVWIWRCQFSSNLGSLVSSLQARGIKVFYDLDDLMFEPELARAEIIDAIRSEKYDPAAVAKAYESIREMMLRADMLVASTKPLAAAMKVHFRPVFQIPNTFDHAAYRNSMVAFREKRMDASAGDGLLRIGYAAGTLTHQRDFKMLAPILARTLARCPHCRLVLFRRDGHDLLDVSEFPEFASALDQIEWRSFVGLESLPAEMARFDINLAPVEVGNRYVEAKSQLKYFDAALVKVPTIASPVQPFSEAIADGVNGFLAETPEDWETKLNLLVDDKALRIRSGEAAHFHAISRYGPISKIRALQKVCDITLGNDSHRADAFRLMLAESNRDWRQPVCSEAALVYEAGHGGYAELAVAMPVFNYAGLVREALESVKNQSLQKLEIIIVNDASTDESLERILSWVKENERRFCRVAVYSNASNSGLGATRNRCFAESHARYILPLDADNKLHAECGKILLYKLKCSAAAFAYPLIKQFGEAFGQMGYYAWNPLLLSCINYIDAMALVDKFVWSDVGGYEVERSGWEDYDFWCKLAEAGYWGFHVPDAIAYYRTHGASMLRTFTEEKKRRKKIAKNFREKHPWLEIPGY